MRVLTDHQQNGLNNQLRITVLDEPGQGGANHSYLIEGFRADDNPSAPKDTSYGLYHVLLLFQNGPLQNAAFYNGKANGISQEALLAIVIDRLRSFQAGPYSCRENALALTKCEEALMWLQKRTADRLRRGVEGTNEK